jgi:hypothetical protein
MNDNNDHGIRIDVATYTPADEQMIETMTLAEVRALDIQAYDHAYAPIFGVYGYKNSEGVWVQRALDDCGLGQTAWDIVHALQLNPGLFLTTKQIDALTRPHVASDYQKHNGRLAGRLKSIRAAHGENGKAPRLFLSRRSNGYAIQWPAQFSWIRLTVIE